VKKFLACYANSKFKKSQDILEKSAYETGKVDVVFKYDRAWVTRSDFYLKDRRILDQPRGNGYWIWKVYLLLDVFNKIEFGDVVMYCDSGIKIIEDLSPLYALAVENDRVFFKLPGGHLNKTWTKRDCFILTGCDKPEYYDYNQTNAGMFLLKKTAENRDFLTVWLEYVRDPRIVTDDANVCGAANLTDFRDHRHDQSVLSILHKKYTYEWHRSPCQYGNEAGEELGNSKYGQLVDHHRGNMGLSAKPSIFRAVGRRTRIDRLIKYLK
jgi:hypothetical protein